MVEKNCNFSQAGNLLFFVGRIAYFNPASFTYGYCHVRLWKLGIFGCYCRVQRRNPAYGSIFPGSTTELSTTEPGQQLKNDKLNCMRKYIRNYVEGGTYFFTMVTKNRRLLFHDPDLCNLFLIGIDKVKSYHPFDLVAYCILPEHIHLLMSLRRG